MHVHSGSSIAQLVVQKKAAGSRWRASKEKTVRIMMQTHTITIGCQQTVKAGENRLIIIQHNHNPPVLFSVRSPRPGRAKQSAHPHAGAGGVSGNF
jgi:hypothetical protein